MIYYKKDGEAKAVFNGYASMGVKIATYTLQIYATSGVMGVQLLTEKILIKEPLE